MTGNEHNVKTFSVTQPADISNSAVLNTLWPRYATIFRRINVPTPPTFSISPPKAARSRVTTILSCLCANPPQLSPDAFCLSEPQSGTIILTVPGGSANKATSNPPGRYVVRFLDNPGPALIDLPESAYDTVLHAPYCSWCLQTHGRTNRLQGVSHG